MKTINSIETLLLKEIAKSHAEVSLIYVDPTTIYIGDEPYDESVLPLIEKLKSMELLTVAKYSDKKVYKITESFWNELTKYVTPQERVKLERSKIIYNTNKG